MKQTLLDEKHEANKSFLISMIFLFVPALVLSLTSIKSYWKSGHIREDLFEALFTPSIMSEYGVILLVVVFIGISFISYLSFHYLIYSRNGQPLSLFSYCIACIGITSLYCASTFLFFVIAYHNKLRLDLGIYRSRRRHILLTRWLEPEWVIWFSTAFWIIVISLIIFGNYKEARRKKQQLSEALSNAEVTPIVQDIDQDYFS